MLKTQEPRLRIGRQITEHQFLILAGFLLIGFAHLLDVCVVGQFAIHVVVGFIIHAQRLIIDSCRLDGIQNEQSLIIHTNIRTAQSEQRTATNGLRPMPRLLSQHHTLLEEEHSRIGHERTVKLIQAEAFLILPLQVCFPFIVMARLRNLLFVGIHILWRLKDSLVDGFAELVYIVSVSLSRTQEHRKKCKKDLVSQCHYFSFCKDTIK